jgi:2-methylcitrate dehydratase PrpD
VSHDLAEHLAKCSFDDLDQETVEITKLSILDTIGVTIAASGITPGISEFVDLAMEWGGAPQATILATGEKVPAPIAAWVNGAMAHCLDFDDLVQEVGYHPSTPTVVSGFATAELNGVRGRDLLLGVALGNDLGVRLANSIGPWQGWFTTPLFGHFAAAATAGKVLGLDSEAIRAAFGIVYCQTAGTVEMRWSTNSNIASYYAAWNNKAGVVSALLAARGIRGIEHVLEGKAGLYQNYFRGEYKRDALTDGLGERFRGKEVGFKPWPSCGGSHPAIDATLTLFAEHGLRPDDVEHLTVATTGPTYALCEPLEVRQAPPTPMDAKFSIPYNIALAAVSGNVALADFTEKRLHDADVLDFARKISTVNDPSLAIRPAALPSRIEVTTTDGRQLEQRCDYPRGTWPHHPLAADEIVDKFRDCVSYAAKPLDRDATERIVDLVMDLEHVDDVRAIGACF